MSCGLGAIRQPWPYYLHMWLQDKESRLAESSVEKVQTGQMYPVRMFVAGELHDCERSGDDDHSDQVCWLEY